MTEASQARPATPSRARRLLPAPRPQPAAEDLLAAHVELPPTLQAAPLARRFARTVLAGWQFSDEGSYTAQLVVTELVANAVRYAIPDGPLRLSLATTDDLVTVEVSDGSPTRPVVPALTDDREGGRGMAIVSRVSVEWGCRERRGGKEVWARLRLPRAVPA